MSNASASQRRDEGSTNSRAAKNCKTYSVISKDGTAVGYRRFGSGSSPGILLLHGAMSSGYNHVELADALADAFTVYVPDRRGRGLSGPHLETDGIQQEVEDVAAILERTGAENVFGVSSGGIILLRAALSLPSIRKAAIYETPFFEDCSRPTLLLKRLDDELGQGDLPAALITGMKGGEMGPAIFNVMPRWLLEFFASKIMTSEDKKPTEYVPMRVLAPTLHYDFRVVVEMNEQLDSLAAVKAEVMLMGGSKSPAYLKTALGLLQRVMPHASRVELPGLDHAGSWNAARGGKPLVVAVELRRFFSVHT